MKFLVEVYKIMLVNPGLSGEHWEREPVETIEEKEFDNIFTAKKFYSNKDLEVWELEKDKGIEIKISIKDEDDDEEFHCTEFRRFTFYDARIKNDIWQVICKKWQGRGWYRFGWGEYREQDEPAPVSWYEVKLQLENSMSEWYEDYEYRTRDLRHVWLEYMGSNKTHSVEKIRCKYNLAGLDEIGKKKSGYIEWSILDPEVFTIYTNTEGKGLFIFDKQKGIYRQIKNTRQFKMPRDKNGARQTLKNLFLNWNYL